MFLSCRFGRRCFTQQKGSALITGMIAALSVGVVSAIIMQQSQVTEKQTRLPRVKSSMLRIESQVREAVNHASSYLPCDPPAEQNCKQLDQQKFLNMKENIPGARCPSSADCGVRIEAPVLSGNIVTARVIYEGSEVSVAPIEIKAEIVNEDWREQSAVCPSSKPLLVGFHPDGSPDCKVMPADCGPGKYVKRIDPMSLTGSEGIVCENFPTSVTCASGQFVGDISWSGSGGIVFNCQNTFNPFAVNAIGDGTQYEYQAVATFSSSSWPTTTTLPPTTTTTTTIPTPTTMPLACIFIPREIECFVAGTQIELADGLAANIEDIQVGQKVKIYDEELRQNKVSEVTEVLHHKSRKQNLYQFYFSNGADFTVTAEHLIYTANLGYVPAMEIYRRYLLNKNALFVTAKGSGIAMLKHVRMFEATVPTYNIHVKGISDDISIYGRNGRGHNYFANGILAHNLKWCNGVSEIPHKIPGTQVYCATNRTYYETEMCYGIQVLACQDLNGTPGCP